jgi:hypothetical protein
LAFVRLKPVEVAGFSSPDSAVHDPEEDVYLVSNVNGGEFDTRSNQGFISKVSPDGRIIDLKWIQGRGKSLLNAPRGMALTEGRLYVADIDTVRIYNRKRGTPIGTLKIPQATYLNSVSATPDGDVYVTNSGIARTDKGTEATGKDSVYLITRFGAVQKVLAKPDLNQPSGVAADSKGAWVVTHKGKQLFHVTKWGKRTEPVELPQAQLDGLVRLNDGRLLVSAPESNVIFAGWPASQFTVAIDKVNAPGGIGYDYSRDAVLIPLTKDNKLLAQPLGEL